MNERKTMNENKCPYCHENADDGYLYEDDISVITKHLYGKAQQVKWTGKDLNNYEVWTGKDLDDSVCTTDCYQDCKIVCTNKGKYFLAVDGEWTTYFPINCCPICGRGFNDTKNALRMREEHEDGKRRKQKDFKDEDCTSKIQN